MLDIDPILRGYRNATPADENDNLSFSAQAHFLIDLNQWSLEIVRDQSGPSGI
jgi:hypothetical protein